MSAPWQASSWGASAGGTTTPLLCRLMLGARPLLSPAAPCASPAPALFRFESGCWSAWDSARNAWRDCFPGALRVLPCSACAATTSATLEPFVPFPR